MLKNPLFATLDCRSYQSTLGTPKPLLFLQSLGCHTATFLRTPASRYFLTLYFLRQRQANDADKKTPPLSCWNNGGFLVAGACNPRDRHLIEVPV